MKKIFLALMVSAFALFSYQQADAQNVIEKGTNIVNLGLGGYFEDGNRITANLSYDYGLTGNLWDSKSAFTLGGSFAYANGKNWNAFLIGPRAGLHYHFIPKLDTYLALTLGYYWATTDGITVNGQKVASSSSGKFGWNLAAGLRYMFTPTLGGFLEFGSGFSNVSGGIAIKF